MATTWQDKMVMVLRGLIFDMTPPYTYTDTRLEEIIVISAALVIADVRFTNTYTIDTEAISITPDPSSNDDFVALVCLKAACLIAQGEYRESARNAISVKDGPSTIDNTGVAKHREGVARDACDRYSKAKKTYRIGDGTLGRTIVGPYNALIYNRDNRWGTDSRE